MNINCEFSESIKIRGQAWELHTQLYQKINKIHYWILIFGVEYHIEEDTKQNAIKNLRQFKNMNFLYSLPHI